MKIALISVAPPYRGGISLNTAILYRELKKKHSVLCYNFSRQYPDFLFPGKTQFETGKPAVDIPSNRCIDSLNPITWLNTAKLVMQDRPDLVIFRFWNPFFGPALGTIAGKIRKFKNPPHLLALCDNIIPHEQHFFDKILINYFLRKMNSFIVMAPSVEADLKQFVKSPKYKFLTHPITNVYGEPQTKLIARQKLHIQKKHFILYFGYVRKYKGLDILIKATSLLKNKLADFQVVALGESYEKEEKYTQLIKVLNVGDVFTWVNRYIPDDEVNLYFSASDVVALPYHSATQSGVVPLAYHFDCPVILTNVGGLPEMVDHGKSGFLIEKNSPEKLAECLFENFSTGKFTQMETGVQQFKIKFSWDKFIEGIEELVQS